MTGTSLDFKLTFILEGFDGITRHRLGLSWGYKWQFCRVICLLRKIREIDSSILDLKDKDEILNLRN